MVDVSLSNRLTFISGVVSPVLIYGHHNSSRYYILRCVYFCNDNSTFLCLIHLYFSLMYLYLLQIDGGQIILSSRQKNPKSIHETFKESLMRIYMKHIQPDPVCGGYKLLTSEGEPMEKLLLKCKILLSYAMGTDALRLGGRQDVICGLLRLSMHYLRDTFKLREMWNV